MPKPPLDDDTAAIVGVISQRLARLSGRDPSLWPPGPWDAEHDGECWRVDYLFCRVERNDWGAWCGYIGLPPGHALYGGTREAFSEFLHPHGGVSWSDRDDRTDAAIWWVGFDCMHGFDIVPGHEALLGALRLDQPTPEPDPLAGLIGYRDLQFVKLSVVAMAALLLALYPKPPVAN